MNQRAKVLFATAVGFSLGFLFCYQYTCTSKHIKLTPQTDSVSSVVNGVRPLVMKAEKGTIKDPQTDVAPSLGKGRETINEPKFEVAPSKTIPRIFHQTWSGYTIPKSIVKYVTSWHKFHPDWEYWFWRDQDIDLFVKTYFPWFLDTFHNYSNPIMRTDVFRYLVLYRIGGVYADADMELLRNMDPLLKDKTCVISQEPLEHTYFIFNYKRLASNAIMASAPGHPFFGRLIKLLPSLFKTTPRDDVQVKTGPKMLEKYLQNYTETLKTDDSWKNSTLAEVYVASADEMMPHFDNGQRSTISSGCYKARSNTDWNKVCVELKKRNFQNKPNGESYTTHHWIHFFAHWFKRNYPGIDVRTLVPVVNVTQQITSRIKT